MRLHIDSVKQLYFYNKNRHYTVKNNIINCNSLTNTNLLFESINYSKKTLQNKNLQILPQYLLSNM